MKTRIKVQSDVIDPGCRVLLSHVGSGLNEGPLPCLHL